MNDSPCLTELADSFNAPLNNSPRPRFSNPYAIAYCNCFQKFFNNKVLKTIKKR